jgi:Zn-dependent M28 family amino/carboxypeptidase
MNAMRHRRLLLVATAALLAALGACAQRPVAAPLIPVPVTLAATQQITAASLTAPIRYLADDLLQGRAPASTGDQLARLYLQSELQSLGFVPGGSNGSWEQPFDIVGMNAAMPQHWRFSAANGTSADLARMTDYIAYSGVPKATAVINAAEVVFVGYGIQAPEYQWDDFKGVDLKGKLLLIMNNDPDWDPALFAGKQRLYYGRWDYKYETAARLGAVGAIIIHTRASAGYPWQVVQSSWSGEQFALPEAGEARLQVRGWATEDAVRRLLNTAGLDLDKLSAAARSRDFKPVALGLKTSLTLKNTVSRAQTANVIGILPGTDNSAAREYVIYTAHHDHLGVGAPDSKGDRIYNGALDNAAGCAQLLAIARAYAALPLAQRPRRSIIMLLVAAEEQGLLGSKYYSAHPTVATGRIAADLNYDGASIWGRTRDVTMIGMGKSTLDAVASAVARFQGRELVGDQFPDRGFYYRSDQFSFAHIGVPAVHFENGIDVIGKPSGWGKAQIEKWEETQYHQPSDQLDASWNFDGMIEDTEHGFYTGWLLANAVEMPKWNAGDEFEAAGLARYAAHR